MKLARSLLHWISKKVPEYCVKCELRQNYGLDRSCCSAAYNTRALAWPLVLFSTSDTPLDQLFVGLAPICLLTGMYSRACVVRGVDDSSASR